MRRRLRYPRVVVLVVAGAILASACAGSAEPRAGAPAAPAAGATAAESQEWDAILAAARQEGRVVVGVTRGEAFRNGVSAFQQAFPDIALEIVQAHQIDWGPRITQERAGGQYLWDAYVGGADVGLYQLAREGFFDPVASDMVLADARDDGKWRNGFAAGLSDAQRTYVYSFINYLNPGMCCVNRDFVDERELPTSQGLWDPKFRGRIAWREPRDSGAGLNLAAILLDEYGEKALRDLFADQNITVSADARQLTEWAIRGRYPIAMGISELDLRDIFHPEGLGFNVKPIPQPGVARVAVGTGGSISLVNRPPHPNARKVFVNWLLSQPGQAAIVQAVKQNSRRLDVPVADPETLPPASGPVKNMQDEEAMPIRGRAMEIAREVLK